MHPLAEDSASEQPQFVKAMRFTKAGIACAGRATGTLGPVCVPARASRAGFMRDGGGQWGERGGRRDMSESVGRGHFRGLRSSGEFPKAYRSGRGRPADYRILPFFGPDRNSSGASKALEGARGSDGPDPCNAPPSPEPLDVTITSAPKADKQSYLTAVCRIQRKAWPSALSPPLLPPRGQTAMAMTRHAKSRGGLVRTRKSCFRMRKGPSLDVASAALSDAQGRPVSDSALRRNKYPWLPRNRTPFGAEKTRTQLRASSETCRWRCSSRSHQTQARSSTS